jgi:uncharacterized protein (DUF433 family)
VSAEICQRFSIDQILEEMPDLEREDIIASIAYAKRGIDHPVIAA